MGDDAFAEPRWIRDFQRFLPLKSQVQLPRVLTMDKARRIPPNIAKLPELLVSLKDS